MSENAFHKLRDEIENGIVTGVLKPGERLDEVQLAARFGVSRTPIREALLQLSATGLIETRPRRSAIVADPEPQRIFEMFEVMSELEGLAGAQAARRHTNVDREALLAAHHACQMSVEGEDADAYYYDNEIFHRAIYEASHNQFLADQCMTLHRRLRPYRRLQLRVRNRLKASFAEHGGIVEAILAGKDDIARELLRRHVVVQNERFSDLIASLKNSTS
ncbi:GntR family transcriptional regulator [Brucella cytisi]|uniref:GntR family transcriptional regulator n=1 Tax=Brucella cytisi TaxID=407152 RepID=A0A1J6I4T5_9HYPH|nr:GntR family transcriptional regulator [Brucella cytisi]OIS92830.1 GntR family transcriptional regulator [Brucella cytisi]